MPALYKNTQLRWISRLPWLFLVFYLLVGIPSAIYSLLYPNMFWSFKILYYLCPPAFDLGNHTTNLYWDELRAWMFSDGSADYQLRMNIGIITPIIIFSALIYWLVGWTIRRAIYLWQARR